MRSRAAVAALILGLGVVASGCGTDGAREGPPFEPGDIEGPESLLITHSDIEGAGETTPYGVVLRWWRALQLGDVEAVRQSYLDPITSREARRQIDGFRPRTSQPIDPEIRREGRKANMEVRVRTANRLTDTPDVVSVRDSTAHFFLVGTFTEGWKLRPVSYRSYSRGRQKSRLAVR